MVTDPSTLFDRSKNTRSFLFALMLLTTVSLCTTTAFAAETLNDRRAGHLVETSHLQQPKRQQPKLHNEARRGGYLYVLYPVYRLITRWKAV